MLTAHSKERLLQKIKDLQNCYGPFLSVHNDFSGIIERVKNYAEVMEKDPTWQSKQKSLEEQA